MGNKLTNSEIKKALTVCREHDGCYKCPSYKVCGNLGNLTSCALKLINEQQAALEEYRQIIIKKEYSMRLVVNDRLQFYDELQEKDAEIERLQNKVEELSEVLSDTIRIRYAEAKTEAIKEFVNKLETELTYLEEYFI